LPPIPHSSLPHYKLLISSFRYACPATTAIYTLSLHDALPILNLLGMLRAFRHPRNPGGPPLPPPIHATASSPSRTAKAVRRGDRSEEHTSELQSRFDLVCRLLLEKKKE